MSAIHVKENSQPSKVGKIEKSYLGSRKRKSPNQRRYSEVRSREHRACRYYFAREKTDTRTIQGYLGQKNIQHTVRYTQLFPEPYKELWKKT